MLYAIMFVIDLLASFLLYEAPDSNNYDIVSSFISVLFFYIVVIGIKNAFKEKAGLICQDNGIYCYIRHY